MANNCPHVLFIRLFGDYGTSLSCNIALTFMVDQTLIVALSHSRRQFIRVNYSPLHVTSGHQAFPVILVCTEEDTRSPAFCFCQRDYHCHMLYFCTVICYTYFQVILIVSFDDQQISIGYFLSDLAMIIYHFPVLGGMEYVSRTGCL